MEKAEYAEFNLPTCGLQFVSCAEKTKPFPDSILFSTKVIFAVLPIKAFPADTSNGRQECIFVVVQATPKILRRQAQGLVSLTNLHACEQWERQVSYTYKK